MCVRINQYSVFTALGLIFPCTPMSRNIEKCYQWEEWKGLAWFPSAVEEQNLKQDYQGESCSLGSRAAGFKCTPASSFPIQELLSSCKEWVVQSESSWHSATWQCSLFGGKPPGFCRALLRPSTKGPESGPGTITHTAYCNCLTLSHSYNTPLSAHPILWKLMVIFSMHLIQLYVVIKCSFCLLGSFDKGLPKSDPHSAIVPLPISLYVVHFFFYVSSKTISEHPSLIWW